MHAQFGSGSKAGLSRQFVIIALLTVVAWLLIILLLGSAGMFHAEGSKPPVATLAALLVPPLILLMLARVPRIRAQFLAIDPIWLTAMQGLRILGAGFLFVYAFGHLPALFAHMAGWGDIVVAALAPLVCARLAADRSFTRSRWYAGFHTIGLLDFVGAVGSGLVARGTLPILGLSESTAALGQFPLLVIPCFAVPLWICLHTIAFIQIRESCRGLEAGAPAEFRNLRPL